MLELAAVVSSIAGWGVGGARPAGGLPILLTAGHRVLITVRAYRHHHAIMRQTTTAHAEAGKQARSLWSGWGSTAAHDCIPALAYLYTQWAVVGCGRLVGYHWCGAVFSRAGVGCGGRWLGRGVLIWRYYHAIVLGVGRLHGVAGKGSR